MAQQSPPEYSTAMQYLQNRPEEVRRNNHMRYSEMLKILQNKKSLRAYRKENKTTSEPIIILDDDEEEVRTNENNLKILKDLLRCDVTSQPQQNFNNCANLETAEEAEIRITGVSQLREWIDISELDGKIGKPTELDGNWADVDVEEDVEVHDGKRQRRF